MEYQKTIKEPIRLDGFNIYTCSPNHVIFHPAKENTGLVFKFKNKEIPALLKDAQHKGRAIAIKNGKLEIKLVEHLLSPVYALGIDNLIIELSDGVCPTMPNCSKEYFQALKDERYEQSSKKLFWKYNRNNISSIDDKVNNNPDKITIIPRDTFGIKYHVSFPNPLIGEQSFYFEFNEKNYENQLMEARSPVRLDEPLINLVYLFYTHIFKKNNFRGITKDNYLIIPKFKPGDMDCFNFNPRYAGEEFVRHKILDVLGTLALTGRQFRDTGFVFNKTGHKFDLYVLDTFFKGQLFADSN